MIGATDIFVSYKAEDRSRLRPLVTALEAEGFTVWWDTHIGGGAHWREDIEQHLEAAKCVIVAWSKRSVGPAGDFVRDEANHARKRGAYLPICIDPVEPPLGFGEVQAIALKRWRGNRGDPRFLAIADAVRHLIAGEDIAHIDLGKHRQGHSRRLFVASGLGLAALAAVGGWYFRPSAPGNAKRIAVLPFANLSGDATQSYFSEGVAEELRSALARIGLEVIGRASSEAVKDLDAKAAASKLGVPNILTGSVRRSPEVIRVSAQLVSGADGVERWAQSYDRAPGDAIKIQSDIAASVAEALSFALGQIGRSALTLGGTKNAQAQDLLLQAMAAPGRDDSEKDILSTIALVDRALDLDPLYAEAHARKGQFLEFWASQFAASVADKERGQAQAIQASQRAIDIAPRLALSYAALGAIHQDQLLLRRSLGDFERADALGGTDVITLSNYALVLGQSRRQADAQATMQRAIQLDPLNPFASEIQSWVLFNGRRYEESARSARRALVLEPGRSRATTFLGNALLMLGRTDEALQAFRRAPADDYHRIVGEAAISARQGHRDPSKAIEALERRYADSAYYQFAQVYAQAGLIDQGMDALKRAWTKRDPGLSSILVDPFLDPLRKDVRISAIANHVFA